MIYLNEYEELVEKIKDMEVLDAAQIIEDFVVNKQKESWREGFNAGNDTTNIEGDMNSE